MSTVPDRKEATSPLLSEMHGSPSSTKVGPASASNQNPALSDLISPATDDTLATPNTLRSVNDLRSPKTPASETSEGWSAVGKATISGRSGRVIERLQSDLDQAKRDNKSLQLSNDELHSSYALLAAEVDSLRSSAETNETIVANLQAQAGRKDRKITELKEDLAEQKTLRLKAEAAYNNTVTGSEMRVNEAQRERTKAVETAKYYQTQYEVVASSTRRLREEYEQKTKQLSEKMTSMLRSMAEDERKKAQYEEDATAYAAMIQSINSTNKHLSELVQNYQSTRDEEVATLKAKLAEHDEKMAVWQQEAQETVGSMKRVMNVKTTFKGDFND
jgi:DNA repair exonuclease SbcCD ATPase subunit